MENVANLTSELNSILHEITIYLPRLAGFINEFNQFIIANNINILTDGSGNLSADVLPSMSEAEADLAIKRIDILDRIISHNKTSISDLFTRGHSIDNQLKSIVPTHESVILRKLDEFNRIKNTYRH
jgi:hypothetical protein